MAVNSSLSSRDVDICLVPEFYFELYKSSGLLNHIQYLLLTKQRCNIVISEGISNSILDYNNPDNIEIS
jgi:hypothetical protein